MSKGSKVSKSLLPSAKEQTIGLFDGQTNLEKRQAAEDADLEENRETRPPYNGNEIRQRFQAAIPPPGPPNQRNVELISKGRGWYLAGSTWEMGEIAYHWAYLFLTKTQLKKIKDILNKMEDL